MHTYNKPNKSHSIWLILLGLIPLMTIAIGPNSKLGRFPPTALLVGIWLVHMVDPIRKPIHRWDFRLPIFLSSCLLILLLGALPSLFMGDEGWRYLMGRMVFIFMVIISFSTLKSIEDILKFEKVYLLSIVLLTALTVLNAYSVLHLPFMDRVSPRQIWSFLPKRTLGVYMSYGEHGILLSLGFAFIFYKLFTKSLLKSKLHTIVYWCLLLIFIYQMLITQSRSSYLAFIIMVFVFFAIGMAFRLLNRAGIIIGTLFGLFLVITLPFMDLASFYDHIYSVHPSNVDSRLTLNLIALDIIVNHPLLGIGYGNAINYVYDAIGKSIGIHNIFLLELVSTGILIGAIYILTYVWAAATLLKILIQKNTDISIRSLGLCLFSTFTFSLIALSFFGGFYVEILAVFFALTARLNRLSSRHHYPLPSKDPVRIQT